MNMHVISDLHLEFFKARSLFRPPPQALPRARRDVLICAGDLHVGTRGREFLIEQARISPVIYVLGNHEYYHGEFTTTRAWWLSVDVPGLHVLENKAASIGGVRFLGATLWADCSGGNHDVMRHVGNALNDFSLVRFNDRRFTPADMVALHAGSLAWLQAQLALPFPGPTVVVTHHLPSWRSVAPQFAGSAENGGFVSDLDHVIERFHPDLWIHGHTHASCDYTIGTTRVLCNPRGYPNEENPRFDPGFLVSA